MKARAATSNPAHRPNSNAPPISARPSEERATIPSAAQTREGARSRRGSRRSPKRPAHQRERVLAAPRNNRAVAAEKSPGPGAARGRKVTTTPEAAVQEAKSRNIRRSGPLLRPEKNPAPPRSPPPSDEGTP